MRLPLPRVRSASCCSPRSINSNFTFFFKALPPFSSSSKATPFPPQFPLLLRLLFSKKPAMPPFRNPFVRKAPAVPSGAGTASLGVGDENARPIAANGIDKESSSRRPDYTGASRASSALSIKSRQEEPREYKLSGKSLFFFSLSFTSCSISLPGSSLFFFFLDCQFVRILKKCLHTDLVVDDSGVYLPVPIPLLPS